MTSFCNESCPNDQSPFCLPYLMPSLLGVISAMLAISLACNIFCCVSKYCSGKGKCQTQSRSARQMEDNPIYGNLTYTSPNMPLATEADPPHSSLSSPSLRDKQRVIPNSQSETQDCYANLALKPPRSQSGRTSPQIQYSDVVQFEVPSESEKGDEGNTDTTMSDLYASVQTQRAKVVSKTDSGEDYANHL